MDRVDWTSEQLFSAYGLRFGLRVNVAVALSAACAAVPLGWQTAPSGEVDVLYSLIVTPSGYPNKYLLYCGSKLIDHAPDLETLLTAFTKQAELLTAERAQDHLFVHAGVVGWHGRAILIPGRSFSGKTTLVKTLVEAGASYYSDEFAVLDRRGQVHPYALPLSLRDGSGQPAGKLNVNSIGGQIGHDPLPVGLIVVTHYQPGATWRPRVLSPGRLLLALMDNAVAAQGDPAHSMPILRAVLAGATGIVSKRGEAELAARAILRRLSA